MVNCDSLGTAQRQSYLPMGLLDHTCVSPSAKIGRKRIVVIEEKPV